MAERQPAKTRKIQRMDEIPLFSSEIEEAEYWSSHSLGEDILATMEPLPNDVIPAAARTRPIAIRFDADILRRLKALAGKKQKGYQTLLKEFVIERLYEEEKREGVVGRR